MRYTMRRAIFHYPSKERGVSNVWIHDRIQNLGYVYFLESIKERKENIEKNDFIIFDCEKFQYIYIYIYIYIHIIKIS